MPIRYRWGVIALVVAILAVLGSFAIAAGGNEPGPKEIVRTDSVAETTVAP